MSDRAFKNQFADYAPGSHQILDDSLKRKFEESVEKYLGFIENPDDYARYLKVKPDFDTSEGDYSVYTGQAGIAYLYYRLGKKDKALERLEPCLRHLKGRRVTFLCGDAGPLALACVLYSEQGDAERNKLYLEKLLNIISHPAYKDADLPDELLYGRAGYLYALLFVRKFCGERSIPDTTIRAVVKDIISSGRRLSKSSRSRCPLMYEWHEKRYYGAAHGLAGIYALLLQSKALKDEERRELLKPSVDYLLDTAFPSGNFPSSMGSGNDRLVHWCHGAPGVVHLMLLAYSEWKEEKYLNAAVKGGDVIWERGLLKKGDGLCHGTAGNGYAFLHLYQVAKDEVWLYRAVKFADHCAQINKHFVHLADRPLSLFEGLAGTAYYLCDIQDPERAEFPAFILKF